MGLALDLDRSPVHSTTLTCRHLRGTKKCAPPSLFVSRTTAVWNVCRFLRLSGQASGFAVSGCRWRASRDLSWERTRTGFETPRFVGMFPLLPYLRRFSHEPVQPARTSRPHDAPTGVPTRPPPGREATAAPPSATSPTAPTPSRRPARTAERTCHAAAWTATKSSAPSWPSSGRRRAARRPRSCVSPERQLGAAPTASWPGPRPPRPRAGSVATSAGAD